MQRLPMKEMLYQRIEWVKEKGYYLIIVMLSAATLFMVAFFVSAFILFLAQPQQYRFQTNPQFQTAHHNGYKLVAVLQNSFLKSKFCSLDSYANTGRSINQQQFCNFNYQLLPTMNSPFDVNLHGLNSLDIRYATVCLLKFPKNKIQELPLQSNQSDSIPSSFLRNRYVCQKYRAYNKLHIINKMQTDQLIFMEIELQLTDKGFQSLQFLDVKLQFQQERSKPWKLFIDYYFVVSLVICLAIAGWTGAVSFALGIGIIIKIILRQKQQRQQSQLALELELQRKRR